MTAYEAMQEFVDHAQSLRPDISPEAKAQAIVALREKTERETGCRYCTPGSGATRPLLDSDPVKAYIADGSLHILSDGKNDTGCKINFCPNCGKKLKNRIEEYKNDDPLTLEELKKMNGNPIFVIPITDAIPDEYNLRGPQWAILTIGQQGNTAELSLKDGKTVTLYLSVYDEIWTAYTKKPVSR